MRETAERKVMPVNLPLFIITIIIIIIIIILAINSNTCNTVRSPPWSRAVFASVDHGWNQTMAR